MEYKIYKTDSAIEKKLAYAIGEMHFNFAPVVLCIGSDATIADSLGPIVGTKLTERNVPCFVYGSLSKPITAKHIKAVKKYIASAHPYSCVIVIDSAVTEGDDCGYIKFSSRGIKPGQGANKDLPYIGDCSIIAIVCKKQTFLSNMSTAARLGDVYDLAEKITCGVMEYFSQLYGNTKKRAYFVNNYKTNQSNVE